MDDRYTRAYIDAAVLPSLFDKRICCRTDEKKTCFYGSSSRAEENKLRLAQAPVTC